MRKTTLAAGAVLLLTAALSAWLLCRPVSGDAPVFHPVKSSRAAASGPAKSAEGKLNPSKTAAADADRSGIFPDPDFAAEAPVSPVAPPVRMQHAAPGLVASPEQVRERLALLRAGAAEDFRQRRLARKNAQPDADFPEGAGVPGLDGHTEMNGGDVAVRFENPPDAPASAPLTVPFDPSFPGSPARIPAALAVDGEEALVNPEQQRGIDQLAEEFYAEIGEAQEDPDNLEYQKRWEEAQIESDRLLRLRYGDQAWRHHHIQAHRQALGSSPQNE